jgi:hypothetical protein
MRTFRCTCGNRVFFESTRCLGCGATLGFDPGRLAVVPLREAEEGLLAGPDGQRYRLCANGAAWGICNWLVPAESGATRCRSCALTRTVPMLEWDDNVTLWGILEEAKQRLVYSLLALGLPVVDRGQDPEGGLGFDFLEDRRRNPQVAAEHVLTGHGQGIITVNLAEADHLAREAERHRLGEAYRTPLGHLRHESGHYYFERLVHGGGHEDEFRALFGDERADYEAALARYYAAPCAAGCDAWISAYASAHPLEDWAECWAHYLHMADTLETAEAFGLLDGSLRLLDFDNTLAQWLDLGVALNALNRSLGLTDAYPFVLTPPVVEKLRFLHRLIHPG